MRSEAVDRRGAFLYAYAVMSPRKPSRSVRVVVLCALAFAALAAGVIWTGRHAANVSVPEVDAARLAPPPVVDGGALEAQHVGAESREARSELEFFNSLGGGLKIELSEPAQPLAPGLMNLHASPSARIVSLHLTLEVPPADEDSEEEMRALTEAELGSVAFVAPLIRLRGLTEQVIEVRAPDGQRFRVRDLIRAIEQTELVTRANSEWFDGVDVQHVFFEGIEQEDDGVWAIAWGS